MQQFLWAEWYPGLMDGTVGLSCQPVEISGRNYMLRHAAAELIRQDAAWNNGDYEKTPTLYMYAAAGNDLAESPVRIQEEAPTMEAAKALYDKRLAALMKTGDANNTLCELESIHKRLVFRCFKRFLILSRIHHTQLDPRSRACPTSSVGERAPLDLSEAAGP